MDWLERHLSIFPEPRLILVIGAGQGRDLPALVRHSGARLVLVEPQPNWAVFLRRQTVVSPQAEVLECALDEQTGSATLKVFNFPELSSLRPDESLASLLPGAHKTSELVVETLTLGDLAQQLEVAAGENNWLIIDAPDVENAVLDALADEELGRRFDHLVMRTSRRVRVGEQSGLDALLDAFIALGFRPIGVEDLSDGDWPRVHLQRLGRSAKERELESQLETLKQQSEDLVSAKNQLQEQLEQKRVEYENRVSELDEQLQTATQEAEQRLAALTTDLEQSKRALEEGKRLQESKLSELQAALETKTRSLEDDKRLQESKLSELRAALEAKTQALEATEQTLKSKVGEFEASLEAKNKEMSQAADAHRDQREALEASLAQVRSDLSVALRVQALRDADLKELQNRYAKLEDVKNQQHELLTKLGQRLGAASEFLKQLGPANQSDSASGSTDELARAIGGELDSSSG